MGESVTSPGGRRWFRLVPAGDEEGFVRLQIGEAGGGVYTSPMTWAERFSLAAAWDDRERVWVASADVGVSVFVLEADGWRRYAWEEGAAESRRPPMLDVATGESVAWIDATPPPGLRTGVRAHG